MEDWGDGHGFGGGVVVVLHQGHEDSGNGEGCAVYCVGESSLVILLIQVEYVQPPRLITSTITSTTHLTILLPTRHPNLNIKFPRSCRPQFLRRHIIHLIRQLQSIQYLPLYLYHLKQSSIRVRRVTRPLRPFS